MTNRPRVTCLMTSSIDGRLHPSCYTDSSDGSVKDWSAVYEELHAAIGAEAWLVGRVTMAEMAKGEAHPRADSETPPRPVHRTPDARPPFAIAPDSHGQLHFGGSTVGGDAAIVLLGSGVSDDHLAELIADDVSYIVAETERPDMAAMLATLQREFGIRHIALEGGGGLNGAMIEAGLIDELQVLVVPALDGDDGRQGIVIGTDGGLKGKTTLSFVDCRQRDHGTVLLRYIVGRG